MLTKDKAFGDVCYNTTQLKESIIKNYLKKQQKIHVDKYIKIVEFNDNKNTKRIVSKLKEDMII